VKMRSFSLFMTFIRRQRKTTRYDPVTWGPQKYSTGHHHTRFLVCLLEFLFVWTICTLMSTAIHSVPSMLPGVCNRIYRLVLKPVKGLRAVLRSSRQTLVQNKVIISSEKMALTTISDSRRINRSSILLSVVCKVVSHPHSYSHSITTSSLDIAVSE